MHQLNNKNSAKLKKEIKSTMAKINHFVMGTKVMALDNIEVKKGFLGLSTKLIYKPTNSEVKSRKTSTRPRTVKNLRPFSPLSQRIWQTQSASIRFR